MIQDIFVSPAAEFQIHQVHLFVVDLKLLLADGVPEIGMFCTYVFSIKWIENWLAPFTTFDWMPMIETIS